MLLIWLIILVTALLVAWSAFNFATVVVIDEDDKAPPPITTFPDTGLRVSLPQHVDIEGNETECHRELTPCTSHADCGVCREMLAGCNTFDEPTKFVTNDGNEINIMPGESYCMALDRNSARSCNPAAGVWVLLAADDRLTLICSCLYPGVVTQIGMYEDCVTPVGCGDHGTLASVHTVPFKCECEEGYVSETAADGTTPYCRPLVFRDVMYSYFPRHPCPDGWVRADSEFLDEEYRRQFILGDVCVPNPCMYDPITGFSIPSAQIMAPNAINPRNPLDVWACSCSWVISNAYAVHVPNSMFTAAINANPLVPNACIAPFTRPPVNFLRFDIKFFWARDNLAYPDADVCVTLPSRNASFIHPRYHKAVYPGRPATDRLVFKFRSADVLLGPLNSDTAQGYLQSPWQNFFEAARWNTRGTSFCMQHGRGGCAPGDCLYGHNDTQVWFHEAFTPDRCFLTNSSRSNANRMVMAWDPPGRYRNGFPVTIYRDVTDRDRTVYSVLSHTITNNETALANVMTTFPFYSRN